jgi:hypothetical protein
MPILPRNNIITGPNGETAEFVFITPELAAEWLAKNVEHNRNPKLARIDSYARDILNGNWPVTGEAVKFDREGNLIDGQNRLRAVIAAGKGIWTIVVRGLTAESMLVLDSGASRNAADMVVISGVAPRADAKDVASIARAWYAYNEGLLPHAMSSVSTSATLTKNELLEVILDIANIELAARYAKTIYGVLRLPVSAIGVAFLKFSSIDIDATQEFFGRIKDGVQLGPGDPFTTLSRRIAQDAQYGNRRMAVGTALFYLFRTWNAFRTDEQISKFQIGSAGSGWTPMPKVV